MSKFKIILVTLFVMATVALTVSAICDTAGTHAIGEDACLIEGTCVVINWHASQDTWDAAHAKWLSLRK
jgi:hypothetical protein